MGSPKPKPASLCNQIYSQKAYPSPTSLPSPEIPQFQEFAPIPVLALDQPASAWPDDTRRCVGMSAYFHHAGSSITGDVYGLDFARSRSIHTDQSLELAGPLDVAGTIKARNIHFGGDFIVSDAIDAYGNIEINGNMTAEGKIKAFGDIKINGNLTTSGKIEGSSRLKLRGSIHAADVVIYGNVTIRGYLYCRRLVVYGSLILVGPNSTCDVSEYEMITGSRTQREHEPDWDF